MKTTFEETVASIFIIACIFVFFTAVINIIGTVLTYFFWNLLVVQAFSMGNISFFQALVLFWILWIPAILLSAGNIRKSVDQIKEKNKDRRKIKTECSDCGGTGVYSGFKEGRGKAVICYRCEGTGCKAIEYTPFKKRKHRDDIETVILSDKAEIPYEEFFASKKE